ncbi:uncharacterized protein [Musca autumnalis]|uniref:uncharacterized protein n=1 Tax=Musca autumnalis TaxID=221902 RepID=UPI003CEB7A34
MPKALTGAINKPKETIQTNNSNELHIKEEIIDLSIDDDYGQEQTKEITQKNIGGGCELRDETPKLSERTLRWSARKTNNVIPKKRLRRVKTKPDKIKQKPSPPSSSLSSSKQHENTTTNNEVMRIEVPSVGCPKRNQFCYICGQFTPPMNARNITKTLIEAYEKYFNSSYVPTNLCYTPSVVCDYCYRGLIGWIKKSTRHKFKYESAVKWLSQYEHCAEKCYFCSTKVTGFRYNTREKILYPNVDSVVKAKLKKETALLNKQISGKEIVSLQKNTTQKEV